MVRGENCKMKVDLWKKSEDQRASGPMAEWLRRGLQILARRFDSGSGLHLFHRVIHFQFFVLIWRLAMNQSWAQNPPVVDP